MEFRRICLSAVVALVVLGVGAASADPKGSAKVNPALTALHTEYAAHLAQSSGLTFSSRDRLFQVADDRVVIDAVADDDAVALESALLALGMRHTSVFGRFVSGELPIAAIPALDGIVSLRFAHPSAAISNIGNTTSQGDPAMRSDVARAAFGVTGAGVKVGVLSDSFNCLGGAPAGVASNDLSPVQVIQEISSCTGATDEGRAMLEIVHDVAPGASLAFASAFNGTASFANNIIALGANGAKVIVDDVIYLTEPMFQDGPIAQAVDTVVGSGSAYFSSAGNQARFSYESVFRPGMVRANGSIPSAPGAPTFFGGLTHDFDPSGSTDDCQQFTLPPGATITLSLQWDSPNFSVSGAPAVELVSITNNGGSVLTLNLMIVRFTGTNPGRIKYVRFGSSNPLSAGQV